MGGNFERIVLCWDGCLKALGDCACKAHVDLDTDVRGDAKRFWDARAKMVATLH